MSEVSNEDCAEDMECDFIHKPKAPIRPKVLEDSFRTEENAANLVRDQFEMEENITLDNLANGSMTEENEYRPVTPTNHLSCNDSAIGHSYFGSDCEASFIKRAGFDRVNRHKNRFNSSTPLFMNKGANTLPRSKLSSQLSTLANLRQCKSAENVRSRKVGPHQIPYEYVNPFSPDGKVISSNSQKRKSLLHSVKNFDLNESGEQPLLNDSSASESEADLPRSRLSEFNVSRFHEEFVILKEVGKGNQGRVFKCLNRMNGMIYAIKSSNQPISTGGAKERIVRNEIYAHGVLDHPNIVRNYSCWKEDDYVYIQNEYCNGGSLEQFILHHSMQEPLLRSMLQQMSMALRYMHNKGMVHMDVKPGNILLVFDKTDKENNTLPDGGFGAEEKLEDITFKLGDFGHIARLDEQSDVEEGDCRYLSMEIMQEHFDHLDRGDIFSLGLTVYEAAGRGPLPKNGDEWQEIRKEGKLKELKQHSEEFNKLLQTMVHPIPEKRPSAEELLDILSKNSHPPLDIMAKAQDHNNSNYFKLLYQSSDQFLSYSRPMRALRSKKKETEKTSASTTTPSVTVKKRGAIVKPRLIGKKTKRSSSTIF